MDHMREPITFDLTLEGERPGVDQPAELPLESVVPDTEPGIFKVEFRGFETRWFNIHDVHVVHQDQKRAARDMMYHPERAAMLQVKDGHLAIDGRIIYHAEDVFNASQSFRPEKGVGQNRMLKEIFNFI